jgi:hypothetical protein
MAAAELKLISNLLQGFVCVRNPFALGGERDSYFLIALERRQFLQHQRKFSLAFGGGEIYTAATLKVYHRRSSGGGVSLLLHAPLHIHCTTPSSVCSPGTGVVHYARGAGAIPRPPAGGCSSQKESKILSV